MTCKERAMKIENSSQRRSAVQTADAARGCGPQDVSRSTSNATAQRVQALCRDSAAVFSSSYILRSSSLLHAPLRAAAFVSCSSSDASLLSMLLILSLSSLLPSSS